MVRNMHALIEKCALVRERFMAPPTFFLGLPVRDHAAATDHRLYLCTDSPWALSAPFEDTVSGKETGNRGFEKHWRLRRVARKQNRSGPTILEVASHHSNECTIIGDGSEPSRAIC